MQTIHNCLANVLCYGHVAPQAHNELLIAAVCAVPNLNQLKYRYTTEMFTYTDGYCQAHDPHFTLY